MYKIDLSGNTTYSGIAIPTPTGRGNMTSLFDNGKEKGGDDGSLSQSDKIAIGIGIGFGVPTFAVGLGAWLCARRRKGEKAVGVEEEKDDYGSERGWVN
jgi:hypothetical protein